MVMEAASGVAICVSKSLDYGWYCNREFLVSGGSVRRCDVAYVCRALAVKLAGRIAVWPQIVTMDQRMTSDRTRAMAGTCWLSLTAQWRRDILWGEGSWPFPVTARPRGPGSGRCGETARLGRDPQPLPLAWRRGFAAAAKSSGGARFRAPPAPQRMSSSRYGLSIIVGYPDR